MKATESPDTWKCPLKKTAVIGPRIAGETTPFVLNNRLYRVENHPRSMDFPEEKPQHLCHEDEIRIRDVETDRIISVVLRNHYFGEGFVWNGRLHLFAGDYGTNAPWWHIKRIVMTSSEDLVNWTKPVTVIESERGENLFNTGICRGKDRFIMLYETDDERWPKFTFKYCESSDLVHWKRIPDAIYGKDKYVGGPALYYEGGLYYTLYLKDLGGTWETHVTRSRDLIHWQDAPADRPFVTFDPRHRPDPEKHPGVHDLNASDAELCEWNGKTMVYYCGGDQQGVGDLKTAEFDGTPRELLDRYFEGMELP